MKNFLFVLAAVCCFGCEPGDQSAPSPKPSAPTEIVQKEPEKPKEVPQVIKKPSLERHPERINALEDLQVSKITANGHTIDAWVADTDSKRTEGMMYLETPDVKDTQGMIFVFPTERPADSSFWMQHTPLPLDIIYLDKKGKVLNIGVGKPFSEAQVKPAGKYFYVLELKQGMAKKLGIAAGTKIGVPASLKTDE